MDLARSPVPAAPLRVGHIRFLNCLPLYWGLEQLGLRGRLHLSEDTPDRLSDAVVAGALDVGPVSLVEALRAADDLVLLPDLAVTSDGPVESVVLVTRRPLAELDGAVVALGATSRTSVLLARLLLEQRVGVRPSYRTEPPDLAAMLAGGADAAVLIGDPALRATLSPPPGLHVVDLGDAWRQWTGLPMVFAVWAASRRVAEERPDEVQEVGRAFRASRDAARAAPAAVAAAAAAASGLPASDLARYYRRLDFSLGPRQRAGLRLFADRTAGLGALPAGAAGRLRVLDARSGPVAEAG